MARTKEQINNYHNAYRKRKRRERGLQKQGRKPYSMEEKEQAKEVRKEWEKEWRKEYFENSPQKRLLWAARKRSKVKGIDFNIEESDIIIPESCPLTGIKLLPHVPRGNRRDQVMSLDRIDNSKGYVKGNIWVISHLANTMKSNASQEILLNFAEGILKLYGPKNTYH